MTLDLSAYALDQLTPDQIAAIRHLDLIRAEDMPRFAMHWLENGAASDAVAILAGETNPTLAQHGKLFGTAIADMGGHEPASLEEAYWTLTRLLLGHVAADGQPPFPAASDLVSFAHWPADHLKLFTRPDLPPVAARGVRFAGENMGLEGVIGAIFALDDFDHADQPARVAEVERLIKSEAAMALKKYYTIKPAQFPARPTNA